MRTEEKKPKKGTNYRNVIARTIFSSLRTDKLGIHLNQISALCLSFVGFSDDNSEWLTPAKRKRKIDLSEGDEDSDSQWEEEEGDEVEDLEKGEQLEADDDDDLVDDYGAMEDSSEGEEQEEEEAAGSDGEVCKMILKQTQI